MSSTVSVTGDVHGHYDPLVRILQAAGFIDDRLAWAAGARTLWFMGDLVDAGPASLDVVALVMRLQAEAQAAGGAVGCLLGNHEIMFLAAHALRDTPFPDGAAGETFRSRWVDNAFATPSDLDRITPAQVAWLRRLPALAQAGDHLLVHADSALYYAYGPTSAAVNAAFTRILAGSDPHALAQLWLGFNQRDEFTDRVQPGGPARAQAFLAQYGGRQIVHGHTPIYKLTGADPTTVTAPLIYAAGHAVDVDGCLYQGGPGFVWDLPAPL